MLRYTTPAVAGVLALAAACSSDKPTEPTTSAPAAPITIVHLDTARGRILSTDAVPADAGVVMLTDAGDTLRLVGDVADLLANSVNIEVWVQGQMNLHGSMQVLSYALRDVNDGPVCSMPIVREVPVDDPCNGFATSMKPNDHATWARQR